MSVDMELLKKLREITFAPLKDCKDALIESNWDLDTAIEWLKKKGALQAAKKADRETKEWAIKARVNGNTVIAVKMATETDFVVKSDFFAKLLEDLLDTISTSGQNIASINELPEEIKVKCDELIHDFVGKIGENTKLADVYLHTTDKNIFVYTHPGDKIVSILYYSSSSGNAEHIAKQVALQIAAMNPEYLSLETIPTEAKEKLLAELTEEVKTSGKPADMIEKIVAGKFEKAFADSVLLEQPAIWDDSQKIKDASKAIEISSFARMAIGA